MSIKQKSPSNSNKIATLRMLMQDASLQYYLVPSWNQFQGEYVRENEKKLQYISGFTGSNGIGIVGQATLHLITDGRYLLQAQNECGSDSSHEENKEPENWQIVNFTNIKNLKLQGKIAYDPMLFNNRQLQTFGKVFSNLVPHDEDLFASFWSMDKIAYPKSEMHHINDITAGKSAYIKIQEIALATSRSLFIQNTTTNNSDIFESDIYLLINNPESVNWALNLRGSDLEHTPISLCRAIAKLPKAYVNSLNNKISNLADDSQLHDVNFQIEVMIFANFAKLEAESLFCRHDKLQINLSSLNELENYILSLPAASSFVTERDTCPAHIWQVIQTNKKISIFDVPDACINLKACKNLNEIKGTIQAHKQDAAALVKSFFELSHNISTNKIVTEFDFAKIMLENRLKQPGFKCLSFPSIVGANANGAIIHYNPKEDSCSTITKNSMLLVDSGGQYYQNDQTSFHGDLAFGTTDVTRTIFCGQTPSKQMIESYTATLKGHLALCMAKFPTGTTGGQLDALARMPLWQMGENFAHGTGHGVGSYLSVHEGPQSISPNSNVPLKPGMILSNEPGCYVQDLWGIRIENLMLVEPAKEPGFLQMKQLTLFPYEHKLINFAHITHSEYEYLQNYYANIKSEITPLISNQENEWLSQKLILPTKP